MSKSETLSRLLVAVTEPIRKLIQKVAAEEERSESAQVRVILKSWAADPEGFEEWASGTREAAPPLRR